MAATLAQVFPNVTPPLVKALEDEFATLQVPSAGWLSFLYYLLQCRLGSSDFEGLDPALNLKTSQAHRDPTQRTLEARLRNARYLGELAKFRVVPYGGLFSMLKTLLDDFSGHNVDAAAALVEAAGRFLLRLPETETRMANMLEARSLLGCLLVLRL